MRTAPNALILTLAGLSGMAGLAHQMVWTRRLVDLLGASPLTFSKVIGAFFIGLAAGAALASRNAAPVSRPWLRVALAEFLIAALAIPAMLSGNWIAELRAWKDILPFLLVTPPALVMGFVLPWMIRAWTASNPNPKILPLYALNTLGGVAGVIWVLLIALPVWGLTQTALAICGLNIVIAAAAILLDQRFPTAAATAVASPTGGVSRQAIIFAFASGFLVLAMEVLLQHQIAQVTVNSLFSSATVLIWALISLALGSYAAESFARRNGREATIFSLAAILCAVQPTLFLMMRPGMKILPYELSIGAYTAQVSLLSLVVVFPLFFTAGMIFPLQLRKAKGAPGVAALLAWNGLGGWLGSELTQRLIAPALGLWQSIVAVGAGYALLSFGTDRRSLLAIVVRILVLVFFFAAGKLPQTFLNPTERVAKVQVGPEGVVATLECAPDDWRILFNNSYTLGGTRAQPHQQRQAHLPILLHGHAQSVALLGMATGGTLSGAAMHPYLKEIPVAELSPLVIQQAREFFSSYTKNVFADPRVQIFTEDARWMIAAETNRYDVVLGDLFLPWRTGEARLYSLEHFQTVRRALKPDGVFCQWLPLFQLTKTQFDCIARTFQQVFPDALLLRGDFYAELPIVGLMSGRRLEQINWPRVTELCALLRTNDITPDLLVRHADGVAMCIIGPIPPVEPGPINTLANSWLEWDCGQNILGMRNPWFVGIPQARYLQTIHREAIPKIPADLRKAHDAGQFFLTMEIAAKLQLPDFTNLSSQALSRLPDSLNNDTNGDWARWPMRAARPVP